MVLHPQTAQAACWLVLAMALVVPSLAEGPVGAFLSGFDWEWKEGRATWFGNGEWPIHIGGCNYDYLWIDEGTGHDVVALPDVHPLYVGSCGTCWEVRCRNGQTKDYLGQTFDRNVCKDESASVVVRSVDTCQCVYPHNSYSNKRWCCGDMDHLDLSKWAFEKLAPLKFGVIKLEYRPVPCTHKPDKEAWINNPSPSIPETPPSDAKRRTRDWPDTRSDEIVPRIVFNEGQLQNSFKDVSRSAWVQPLEQTKQKGMLGGPGICATVKPEGAFALNSWNGIFQNTVAIEFWAYVHEVGKGGYGATIPKIEVTISGDKGSCGTVRVQDLKPIMFQPNCRPFCTDYWWAYRVYLPSFAGDSVDAVLNDPNWFSGCGGNDVEDLHTIEFRSLPWSKKDASFCLDRIHLV